MFDQNSCFPAFLIYITDLREPMIIDKEAGTRKIFPEHAEKRSSVLPSKCTASAARDGWAAEKQVLGRAPMTRLMFVFYGFLLVVGNSCSDKSNSQPPIRQTAENEAALKDLGSKAGISFPTETRIIAHDNGGRIDPKGGFYQWVIFSSSSVKMPPMQAPGVKDYLDLPLPSSVKSIEVYTGKRKISQPQAAFTSTWETNGFQFRGLLVRSPDGDYLQIQRFLKD